MKKVILDCDNTMGVLRSDIDDGLTFAYLYAHEDIDLLGITCTFANNKEHVVYYNTIQMLEDMNINDVPVLKGGRTPCSYDSEAVDFLIKMANEYPNEVTVIAIGSMNNIAGAYNKDPKFFEKIKRIITMGGLVGDMKVNGVQCEELNYSVDHKSASSVIFNCPNLTLLSAQCTVQAEYFAKEVQKIREINSSYSNYIMPMIDHWLSYCSLFYGDKGSFINWDLCCAIYLTNPELFDQRLCRVKKDYKRMERGYIELDVDGSDFDINEVEIPTTILDLDKFNELFYNQLKKIDI
ncbi:MAG: nucleoside hydrolase [Pleomorphochaeta sp.]